MSSSSTNSTNVLVAQLSTTESIIEALFSEFSSTTLPPTSSYAPNGNQSPRSPVPSPAPPGHLADSDDTINDDEVEEVLSIDKKDPEVQMVSPPTPVPSSPPPAVLTTAVLEDKLARMEQCVWQIPNGEVDLAEQWRERMVLFWKRFQFLKSNEQFSEKHSRIEQRLRTIDMIIWKLFERSSTLSKPVSGLIRTKLDALEETISDISVERAELAKQWQVKLAQWLVAFVERGRLDAANTTTDSTGSYILVDSNDTTTNRTAQENDFGHLVTTNSNSNAATVTAARFENQENGSGFGDDEDTQGEEEEEEVDNDSRMGDGDNSPRKRTRHDDDDEVEVKCSELQRQQQQNQAYGSYDVVASKAQLSSEAHKAFVLIRPIRDSSKSIMALVLYQFRIDGHQEIFEELLAPTTTVRQLKNHLRNRVLGPFILLLRGNVIMQDGQTLARTFLQRQADPARDVIVLRRVMLRPGTSLAFNNSFS